MLAFQGVHVLGRLETVFAKIKRMSLARTPHETYIIMYILAFRSGIHLTEHVHSS
jgi:hypothetical protein